MEILKNLDGYNEVGYWIEYKCKGVFKPNTLYKFTIERVNYLFEGLSPLGVARLVNSFLGCFGTYEDNGLYFIYTPPIHNDIDWIGASLEIMDRDDIFECAEEYLWEKGYNDTGKPLTTAEYEGYEGEAYNLIDSFDI